MARDESAPFARGETFYGLGGAVDPLLGPGGINLEGKTFLLETPAINQYGAGPITADPAGRKVWVRVVRNRSAINLLPRRVVRHAIGTPAVGTGLGTGVDGYVYQVTDYPAGVVDEFLPAAGVPPGDLFYVVTNGPTQVISATTGSISIAAGAQIAATTGTSAVSADAGFVIAMNESTTTVAQYQEKVGRAEANLAATITVTSTIVPCVVNIPLA